MYNSFSRTIRQNKNMLCPRKQIPGFRNSESFVIQEWPNLAILISLQMEGGGPAAEFRSQKTTGQIPVRKHSKSHRRGGVDPLPPNHRTLNKLLATNQGFRVFPPALPAGRRLCEAAEKKPFGLSGKTCVASPNMFAQVIAVATVMWTSLFKWRNRSIGAPKKSPIDLEMRPKGLHPR